MLKGAWGKALFVTLLAGAVCAPLELLTVGVVHPIVSTYALIAVVPVYVGIMALARYGVFDATLPDDE